MVVIVGDGLQNCTIGQSLDPTLAALGHSLVHLTPPSHLAIFSCLFLIIGVPLGVLQHLKVQSFGRDAPYKGCLDIQVYHNVFRSSRYLSPLTLKVLAKSVCKANRRQTESG